MSGEASKKQRRPRAQPAPAGKKKAWTDSYFGLDDKGKAKQSNASEAGEGGQAATPQTAAADAEHGGSKTSGAASERRSQGDESAANKSSRDGGTDSTSDTKRAAADSNHSSTEDASSKRSTTDSNTDKHSTAASKLAQARQGLARDDEHTTLPAGRKEAQGDARGEDEASGGHRDSAALDSVQEEGPPSPPGSRMRGRRRGEESQHSGAEAKESGSKGSSGNKRANRRKLMQVHPPPLAKGARMCMAAEMSMCD